MSDFEDSDNEFDNIRLVPNSPEGAQDNANRPLVEKEFQANFTGSFLEENLFGNSSREAFGDTTEKDRKEKEEFVGLDWDASRIFKNIACPENNTEDSVCVLRLHDILTKSELGILKMNRQLINCGQIINGYTPEMRRDFGFENPQNVKNLLQMIRSLRANLNLMLIETEDLQELIDPQLHNKDGSEKESMMNKFLISGAIFAIPAVAVYFYRRYC